MSLRVRVVHPERCVGCYSCMFACSRTWWGQHSYEWSAIRVKTLAGLETDFAIIVCRACSDPPCARVCPTGALQPREGGGVILDRDKCIGCERCTRACPFGAIWLDPEENKAIVCRYCGTCVQYCPYGVLQMVKTEVL